MDLGTLMGFFTEGIFPVALSAYFVIILSRQLERMRTNQLKMMVLIAVIMCEMGLKVPDTELTGIVEGIKARHAKAGNNHV